MQKQQDLSETPRPSLDRSSLKDKSLSSSRLAKKKLSKRIALDDQLKEFDKPQILAVQRLVRCLDVKASMFCMRGMWRLVANSNSIYVKKTALLMLGVVVKSKQLGQRQLGLRVMGRQVKHSRWIKKCCVGLLRLGCKIVSRKGRDLFTRLSDIVKESRLENSIQIESPPVSKSVDRKPTRPVGKKEQKDMVASQVVSLEQMSRMALGKELRNVLSSLMTYDKATYATEIEKSLKGSVQSQIRRLEKSKVQAKGVHNFNDNELTLTVINNLLRTTNQLKRGPKDYNPFAEEKKQLQKKVAELTDNKNQEIRNLKELSKVKQTQDAVTIKVLSSEVKDLRKMAEQLIGLFNENSFDKTKRTLETQIKRLTTETRETSVDKRDILNIILDLLVKSKQHQDTSGKLLRQNQNILRSVNAELLLLLDEQSSVEKNIVHLETQRKHFGAMRDETKLDLRDYYHNLGLMTSSLSDLYLEIQEKSAEISQINQKLVIIDSTVSKFDKITNQREEKSEGMIVKLRQDLEEERSRSKDLDRRLGGSLRSIKSESQEKKNTFPSLVREWQEIMQDVIEKIRQGDKSWTTDMAKNKKWLVPHKNNGELNRMVNNSISLLQLISGKERQDSDLRDSPSRPSFRRSEPSGNQQDLKAKDRIKQLTRENSQLTQQVLTLSGRINSVESQAVSRLQVSEFEEIIFNINQIMISEDKDQRAYWEKIKEVIKEHRVQRLENAVGCFSSMVDMIIQQIDEKGNALKDYKDMVDQMQTLKASTKAFALLSEKEFSEDNVDKMRGSVLSVISRLEDSEHIHGQLSSLNTLYILDSKSKLRILEIVESQVKLIKELREENIDYILKMKEVDTQKQLDQKLRVPMEAVSLIDSGRRFEQLMKVDSSLEDIVQQKEESNRVQSDRIRMLETERDSLNEEMNRYQEIFQRYSGEEKAILQKIEDYDQEIRFERQKNQQLQYNIQQLQVQKRDLNYRLSLAINDKTILENALQNENVQQDQFDNKERVIQELSKDISLLDNKVAKLHEQNEKMDSNNRQLNERVMTLDATNIDLSQRVKQLDHMKEEMSRMVRQNSLKSLLDQQSSLRELQLANEVEQFRIMIDQLSRKTQAMQLEKQVFQSKQTRASEQNQKLLTELQRTLVERESSFKEYQEQIMELKTQHQTLQALLNDKQTTVKNLTIDIDNYTQTISNYEERIREDQARLHGEIEGVVSERLAVQQNYYKNLLNTNNASYDAIIKNQMAQIERLGKQAGDNSSSLDQVKQLQAEILKLKSQNTVVQQNFKELQKAIEDQQYIVSVYQEKEDSLTKQVQDLTIQVEQLKTQMWGGDDVQEKIRVALEGQETYFNGIINENADSYVNNQRKLMQDIDSLRGYIAELETLLQERELALSNQYKGFEEKDRQLQELREVAAAQQRNSDSLSREVELLGDRLSIRQDQEDRSRVQQSTGLVSKLLYMQKNQQALRSEIDRLVQENKALRRDRQRTEMFSQQDNSGALQTMKEQLRQLEGMLLNLKDDKQQSITKLKSEIQAISAKSRQKEVELIEQERYNSTLATRFEERERELVEKINNADALSRQLSDQLEAMVSKYNNLRVGMHDSRGDALSGSRELSLAEKLEILSHSANIHKNAEQLPTIRIRTQNAQTIHYPPHHFNLGDSRQIDVVRGENTKLKAQLQHEWKSSKSLEHKFKGLYHQKQTLEQKVYMIGNQLQDRDHAIEDLKQENRKLDVELKRMNERIFASQVKNILSIDETKQGGNQLKGLQLEVEKLKHQNAFIRQKNAYLETELRASQSPSRINRSQSSQIAGLVPKASSKNLKGADNSNKNQLGNRLSAMIAIQEAEQEDILEINILKKISEEVGQLVQSNNHLLQKVRTLEKQNGSLYDTINSLSEQIPKDHRSSKTLVFIHNAVLRLVSWMESSDILTEREIKFAHTEQKLQSYVKKNNTLRYTQLFEDFFKNTISHLVNNREDMLTSQAQQLLQMRQRLTELVNDQIHHLNKLDQQQYSEPDSVQIDSPRKLKEVGVLLKVYSKTKNPNIMAQVQKLLYKKKTNTRNYY